METIREILDIYQIRKTKKQKSAFIEYVKTRSAQNGYPCRIEKGSFGARNIVVGDPDSAKVVYTAHYDTCPMLPVPNFITPKSFAIYFIYQLLLTLGIFAVMFAVGFAVGFCGAVSCRLIGLDEAAADKVIYLLTYAVTIGILILFFAGPANKHTANDNTSGVVTLLEIMERMPEEKRENAAFIFFDLEESGLLGSSSYASKHKEQRKNKLLLNFDCVSDGNNIIFALRKGAKSDAPLLERYFESNEDFNVEILSKGVFYPSDQMQFNRGVGVAALKYSKTLRTLYMDRIHTSRDVILDEKNIEYLAVRGAKMAAEME